VSQFVMCRRMFAGVMVIVAMATSPIAEPHEPRRVVALGRISRRGGQITISDRLVGLNVAPATAGR